MEENYYLCRKFTLKLTSKDMEKTIQVRCQNNGTTIEVPIGSNLQDIYEKSGLEIKYGPLSAHVNNKVEGMHYRLYSPKDVEFLDITSVPTPAVCSSFSARQHTHFSIPVRWLSTSLCPMAIMSI